AVVGVGTLPFVFVERLSIRLFMFVVDAIDFGYTLYDAYSQIAESDAEIEFASGASIAIGDARYETALKNAQTWIGHAAPIGMSGFGAFVSAYDVLPRVAALRRVARGRQLTQSMSSAADFSTLKLTDLEDFSAFAMSAFARAGKDGVSTLTSLERRAIDLVDELKRKNPPIGPAPEPDVRLLTLTDDFAPAAPIRFVPDPERGFARIRGPPEGAIVSPRTSGEIPNALAVRVPENAHVRFRDPKTGELHEIPLGRRLGKGSTSETLTHPDFDDKRAVRITYLKSNSPAAAVDRAGEGILRGKLRSSNHIRAVELFEDYSVSLGKFKGKAVSRVSIVEQLEGTAWQRLGRKPDGTMRRMTDAELAAWAGAHRDLNRQAVVWLDNKGNNFDFVKVKGGGGRVQVVAMDMGGIVPIRKGAGAEFGITDA
ncbi:MAG: hypothetical protein N2B03_05560, partial [Boseongicola sp.]